MTLSVNQHAAQQVHMNTERSFESFKGDVGNLSRKEFRFEKGEKVRLNPHSQYCLTLLEVKETLSPEKFKELEPYIENAIVQAVIDGVLEHDWYRKLNTVMDWFPQAIPEEFEQHVAEQGKRNYIYLNGYLQMDIDTEEIPPALTCTECGEIDSCTCNETEP
jgi:hypothetical protein